MSTSEGKQCQRGPQQSAGLLSSRAACAAVLLSLAGMHGAEAFAPGMPISRGPSSAAATVASGLAMRASRPGRMVGPSMIYTPPSKKTDPRTLEEIKEALDRAVRIPSPLSRESPKVAVPRSPCTSLYGNWRPTTGTENWKSASGRTTLKKPTKSAVAPAERVQEGTPAPRGRPPAAKKSAVKDELLPEFVARAAKILLVNKGMMDSNLFGQAWKMIHPNAPLSTFKNHKAVAVHQMMRENDQFFTVGETNRHKVKMFTVLSDKVDSYLDECGWDKGVLDMEGNAQLVKLRDGMSENPGEMEEEEDTTIDATNEEDDEPTAPAPSVRDPRLAIMDVPMQGKARNSNGYDRREVKQRKREIEVVPTIELEDMAAAPRALAGDALSSATIELYNGWAVDGRDVVMEVSNEGPLSASLKSAVGALAKERAAIKAVDLGSGNGWAARLTKGLAPEASVTAVDAAALMVKRANELDKEGLAEYVCGDVDIWEPTGGKKSLDLVLAVELLHLVEDPKALLERAQAWLRPGGRLVVTLECYKENRLSRSWAQDLGIPMNVLAQKKWVDMVEAAGFAEVEATRSQPKGPWPGMLILEATKA